MTAAFDCWAEYYDYIHKGLPGEAEFYIAQALRTGGRTLELGCGTGRITLPMAMSGVDVTGLDNSHLMLEQCREKMEILGDTDGRLTLVEADMTHFELGELFDFVAMPYRTFMHLLTPGDQRACLAAVRAHLKPNGLFVLNTWGARPSHIAPFLNIPRGTLQFGGRYEIPGDDITLLHYCSSSYDEMNQLLSEEHFIYEADPEGNVLRAITLPLRRAWTTPREMDNLLRACGFEVDAVFGDFDCNPLSNNTQEMIWALRKAE